MVTQIATNNFLDVLQAELSTRFPPEKVNEVFVHYDALIRNARLDDYEACLVNGGKFVEAVLKCLHYLRTQVEVATLKVEDEVMQLERANSLDSSERLTIPRTLRLIYEHRNKRGGAHNNSFNPNEMDAAFVVAAAKWVMEELARLYLTQDPATARMLVANLLVKEIPLVEEIDSDLVILRPDLSARIQLEILLYRQHPNSCTITDLISWTKQNHSEHNIRVTLRQMKVKALVHENGNSWKLTTSGVHEAETEIAQLKSNPGRSAKKTSIKRKRTKGTTRGGK